MNLFGFNDIGSEKVRNQEFDLHYHLGISKAEVKELLDKFSGSPKMELKRTVFYLYQQFL